MCGGLWRAAMIAVCLVSTAAAALLDGLPLGFFQSPNRAIAEQHLTFRNRFRRGEPKMPSEVEWVKPKSGPVEMRLV